MRGTSTYMTGIPSNVKELIGALAERSQAELELVRALSEALRRADEQMLKEVRSVAMLHEVRREAIFGALQDLAQTLCVVPARTLEIAPLQPLSERTAVEHQPIAPPAADVPENGRDAPRAGDWRQAAQRIDEELALYFNGPEPRH